MDRRHFLKVLSILGACPARTIQAIAATESQTRFAAFSNSRAKGIFPATLQLSPLPEQAGWEALASRADAKTVLRDVIDEYIGHGFTGLEYPFHLPPELEEYCLHYARSRDILLTYNYTFAANHGVEIFGGDAPPLLSVYSAGYAEAVRQKLAPVLDTIKRLPAVYNLFCYQDEPFHARPASFDTSEAAQAEFRKLYGYDMPTDIDAARDTPRQWLDLINFQSDTFPRGWKQVYRAIKDWAPDVKVILTHDSHSAFGAGVGSNEKVAVDDVFHWGADFADTFVFDIYPYMMHDFRYGECGKIRKPRMSQMHFAFAQMRNLAYAYGKELGFWFGTYNREWFKGFMGPELKSEPWAEAETTFTAVAQGANFLISGYKVPEDKQHWDTLGNAMRVLQESAPGLLACRKIKAKACFLFPRTQYIQLQQEYWNVAIAYELFLQAFGELDCLHEEQIRDHGLGDYQILVLFDVVLLPAAVAKRIVEFVNRGGTVIADCVPRLDEYRNPITMLNLFGVEDTHEDRVQRSGVWVPSQAQPHWFIPPAITHDEDSVSAELVDGAAFGAQFNFRVISPRKFQAAAANVLLKSAHGGAALTSKQSGSGTTYLFGFCMQDTAFATWKDEDSASRRSLQQLLWAITQRSHAIPNTHSANPDIEVSLRSNDHNMFAFAINHEAEIATTRVSVATGNFAVSAVQNLTERRRQQFEVARDAIVIDIDVPRERPQLLQLLKKIR